MIAYKGSGKESKLMKILGWRMIIRLIVKINRSPSLIKIKMDLNNLIKIVIDLIVCTIKEIKKVIQIINMIEMIKNSLVKKRIMINSINNIIIAILVLKNQVHTNRIKIKMDKISLIKIKILKIILITIKLKIMNKI